MAMTKRELGAKYAIEDKLGEEGYPTYARLFSKFDLNLTKDPNVVGYMQVDRARIVLNENLNIDQVSTIVRHEILHEYLTHYARELKWKEKNPTYKNIPHDLLNIAADFEISNVGYTDKDKNVSRNIFLNDKILKGLVTEDHHPDWVDLSFEDMLDKLVEESDEFKNNLSNLMQQLSNMGDESIQQAEELERQANAISDDAGEMLDMPGSDGGNNQGSEQKDSNNSEGKDNKNSNNNSSASNKSAGDETQDAKDIKDKADKLAKKASDLKDAAEETGEQNSDQPFKSPEQQKKEIAIAKRIENLKKEIDNLSKSAELLDETERAVDREKAAKKAKDLQKYRDNPDTKFRASLNTFIRNQIGRAKGNSWSKINKNAVGFGLLRKGISRFTDNKVPLINIYFDRSGSWGSEEKTARGKNAISTLNQYARQGKIKLNLYYFSNNVHSTAEAALAEGGTYGQPILDHIEQTRPDNVIVITDSDISDCESYVTIPGGVWLLFYDGISENLIDHLHGKKSTKVFDMDEDR